MSSSSIVNAITVLTPEGKTILDREYNSQSVKIDIGQYPAGTYIVIIKTSEGTFTRKVVKR
ncbi:MAG: T9SS type A sorting domain-containing protein [Bacteroidales bacterium]|nr:T9SS type A sorting domain-containing protein [Bacteroidales bacterium]